MNERLTDSMHDDLKTCIRILNGMNDTLHAYKETECEEKLTYIYYVVHIVNNSMKKSLLSNTKEHRNTLISSSNMLTSLLNDIFIWDKTGVKPDVLRGKNG